MKRILFVLLIFAGLLASGQVVRPVSGFDDPTTTTGDIIYRDASGDLVRLAVGGLGEVLKSTGTIPEWGSVSGTGTVTSVAMTVPTGLSVAGTPVTAAGTLALTYASGYSIPTDANQTNWTAGYNDKVNSLAFTGTGTKTLTLTQQDGGTVSNTFTDIGFADPLTTRGDVMRYGSGGTERLALGSSGQALLSDGTDVLWGDVYSDPLTTAGDLPYYGAAGTTRLAAGSEGQVLTMGATYPEWAAASGGGDTSYFDLSDNRITTKAGVDELATDSLILGSDADNVSGVLTFVSSNNNQATIGITASDYLEVNNATRMKVPDYVYNSIGSAIEVNGNAIEYGNGTLYSKFGNSSDTYIYVRPNTDEMIYYFGSGEGVRMTSAGIALQGAAPLAKLDVTYASGVFLRSFRGTTDTDITGWIMTNSEGDTCYVYPNSAGNAMEVSTTKP